MGRLAPTDGEAREAVIGLPSFSPHGRPGGSDTAGASPSPLVRYPAPCP
jgi:hypothetical protein